LNKKFVIEKSELVYKPDSVKDDHLSWYYVAIIF